jgi:hypothetical protein
VTASVSDKADAKLLAARLAAMFSTLKLMWADACYGGKPLREFLKRPSASRSKSSCGPARTPSRSPQSASRSMNRLISF